jgi:hypothetical protein
VEVGPDEPDWEWTGGLRDIRSSSVILDSTSYGDMPPTFGNITFSDDFNDQFDALNKGGATAVTLIIVLIVFSSIWLVLGAYNETKRM